MTILRLCWIVIIVIVVGLSIVYLVLDPLWQASSAARDAGKDVVVVRNAELGTVLTLVVTSLVTLFGTLAIRGAQDDAGNFREPRVRFSLTITFVVFYFVFLSMALYWTGERTGTSKDMIQTFTNLLMIVIPFYFGASAYTQVAEKAKAQEAAKGAAPAVPAAAAPSVRAAPATAGQQTAMAKP
jgi:hypothetical protein